MVPVPADEGWCTGAKPLLLASGEIPTPHLSAAAYAAANSLSEIKPSADLTMTCAVGACPSSSRPDVPGSDGSFSGRGVRP